MKHLLVLFSILLISTSTYALTSKGKPFVEIAGQVHELENVVISLEEQIAELVIIADTLDQQIINNSTTITDLQNQNASLQVQIDSAIGDVVTLQAEINNNNLLIVTIQDDIDSIIDILATKQNILEGVCPTDSALQEIMPDGAIVCAPIGGSGLDIIRVTRVIPFTYTSATITTDINCPVGYTVMGAGWEALDSATLIHARVTPIYVSKPITATTWRLTVRVGAVEIIRRPSPAFYIPNITCIR